MLADEKVLRGIIHAVTTFGATLPKEAGRIEHTVKSNTHDLLTRLDTEGEQYLRQRIELYLPGVGFHGEEFGKTGPSGPFVTIDPIDGTQQLVRDIPQYTVMISLVEVVDGRLQPTLAVIYNPSNEQLFTTIRGSGAYCNHQRLQVSSRPITQAWFALETRDERHHQDYSVRDELTAKGAYADYHELNAGNELTLVASGKIEGRLAFNCMGKIWDYAPGALLIQEAGGIVHNVGSQYYDPMIENLVAVAPSVYDQIPACLKPQ